MCFSAGASFGAGIALAAAGVMTLQKATNRSQTMFAAIPLLFSFQQLIEGMVWLSFMNPAYVAWRVPASYAFLVFAHVIWPFWTPMSFLLLEKEKKRIRVLQYLSAIGVIVSAFLAFSLINYHVESSVGDHHIAYRVGFPPFFLKYGWILYVLATAAPPFVSGLKKMWAFGLTVLLAYVFARLFFFEYDISVWCFFAAVISLFIYFIMKEIQKPLPKFETYYNKL